MKRYLQRISWPLTALLLVFLLAWLPARLTGSSLLLVQQLHVQGDAALLDRVTVQGQLVGRTGRASQLFAQVFSIRPGLAGQTLEAEIRLLSSHEQVVLRERDWQSWYLIAHPSGQYTVGSATRDDQTYLRVTRQDDTGRRQRFAQLPVDLRTDPSLVSHYFQTYDPWYARVSDLKQVLAWAADGRLYGIAPAGEAERGTSCLFRVERWLSEKEIDRSDAPDSATVLAELPLDTDLFPLALLADSEGLVLVRGQRRSNEQGKRLDGYTGITVTRFGLDGQVGSLLAVAAEFYNVQAVRLTGDTLSVVTGGDALTVHVFQLDGAPETPARHWGSVALTREDTVPHAELRDVRVVDNQLYLLHLDWLRPVLAADNLSVSWADGTVLRDVPWVYLERAQTMGRQDLRLSVLDRNGTFLAQTLLDIGLNDDLRQRLAADPNEPIPDARQAVGLMLEEVSRP
ncbi:MAG: hypothetical protein GX112_01785 [Clostridiaceae bacterium]|nr:hypothetical protein [Clostridiaceae bacterium]